MAERVFFDAGLFIAALCEPHENHQEAWPIVEAARTGAIDACTSPSILSEVYGVITWEKTIARLAPEDAARNVRLLVQPSSEIDVLGATAEAGLRALDLAAAHGFASRRVHDARHAAVALAHGLRAVYTYDPGDWSAFEDDGLRIAGPPSVLRRLGRPA